jgi:hypothetical protein
LHQKSYSLSTPSPPPKGKKKEEKEKEKKKKKTAYFLCAKNQSVAIIESKSLEGFLHFL